MAEGDVELGHVIDDDTVQLLFNFDEEVRDRSKHHSGSIYMVPSVYRDISPRSFTPRVVSIGPLHHEDEHLKGFEVQKETYMHNLFHNVLCPCDSTPEQIIKACVTKVSGSIDQIKACYIGMKTYPDSELVKMMVRDACFILAFIYDRRMKTSLLGQNNSIYTHIYLDMVLIENQIPFFVLHDIYQCTFFKLHPTVSLADYIYCIQDFCNVFDRDPVKENSSISSIIHDHILSFLHKCYEHPDLNSSPHYEMVQGHSVVDLDRAGVRFCDNLDSKWRMAMELELSRFLCFPLSWSKPTFKMPILYLNDYSELIMRNLIIYEHSSKVQTCVTSYMHALDKLIDTPEDVAKLVKSQVLVNELGSDENAANLINNILKDFPVQDFFYRDEWMLLDKYYNAYWPNLIAELRRKYFSNPWSIIALLAGIVLFVLTVVQTVYSVKDSKAA